MRLALFWSGTLAAADEPIDFARDIAPIFRERCLSCHAERAAGGLQLTTRALLLKGGDSGSPIHSSNGAQSLLLQLISASMDADQKMPPEGSRLTDEQISKIRRWIDDGAVWPNELALKSPKAAAADHWAFQPIVRSVVPDVRSSSSIYQPIDQFIQERFAKEKVTPSPAADRVTLLRRATLDLTGLPPTPEEIDDFLADDRPDAYERQIDRLFAAPEYGERWARPWLDLCHFADTDGYLTDQLRPVAWRYRQWVIDAFNCDLPFDEFTIEQLAGDLLPNPTPDQLLATGFLRNTLSNREGGADLEQYRVEQVIDRTQMVGVGWLGLTVGCARCHDHKFDPISQQEFYQFYAFLDQADEVNVALPLPGESLPTAAQNEEYHRRRTELIAPVKAALDELQARWEAKLLDAYLHPASDALWNRQWEVLGLVWGGNLGEGQLEGTVIVRTPLEQRTRDEADRLQDYFLANGSLIDGQRFAELKLGELSGKLTALKKEFPWPTRAPITRQARFPRPVHIHSRGDFRVPGNTVQPETFGFLPVRLDTVARSAPSNAQYATQSTPNRLALARWLIAADHPLTARVAVNRTWQEFFGRGLVDPPDDFGLRGQAPSHPELLDWLATEFSRRNWSTKSLQRLLATSATYRQSSRARPELQERDPQNRWLARQATFRFNSDQVRDVTLAVSGLLQTRIGGPSVFPPQPDSVSKEGFDQHGWKTSAGPDRYRRGLYTWLTRLSPFAQNVTFDSPPTNAICTRRDRSNSPLQALTLLNDPVFFEAAQALAVRVLSEADEPATRAERLFRLAVGRSPQAHERDVLTMFYQQQLTELPQSPAAVERLVPQPLDSSRRVEQAAWTNTASVVLNLHEFITRE